MQHNQLKPKVEGLVTLYPEVNSSNLEELEALIRRLDKKNSEHIFEIIRALFMIEDGKLYERVPGCDSLDQYYEMGEERLDMPKQTLSLYRRVKDGYYNNVTTLDDYGIEVKGKLVHLAYLEKAFNTHGRNNEEILTNLKTMSAREFIAYARGTKADKEQPSKESKSSSKGKSRKVSALTLDEDHEKITKILMRRHEVFILRVHTSVYAQHLQDQLLNLRTTPTLERKANANSGVIPFSQTAFPHRKFLWPSALFAPAPYTKSPC